MTSLRNLQWATSHNTYVYPGGYNVDGVYDAGYRGIELDIARVDGEWRVGHTAGDEVLATFLAPLCEWSNDNPDHEPLFVHFDCKEKEVGSEFPHALDSYVRTHLPDCRFFSPGAMMQNGEKLVESARWPAFEGMMGMLIPVLSGSLQPKTVYAKATTKDSLMFCDIGTASKPFNNPGSIIANCDNAGTVAKLMKWIQRQPAWLARVYTADSRSEFREIASTGAHMIATNNKYELPMKGYWPNPLIVT